VDHGHVKNLGDRWQRDCFITRSRINPQREAQRALLIAVAFCQAYCWSSHPQKYSRYISNRVGIYYPLHFFSCWHFYFSPDHLALFCDHIGLSEKNKRLAQELALLRQRYELMLAKTDSKRALMNKKIALYMEMYA
jgi:hypothetical protein